MKTLYVKFSRSRRTQGEVDWALRLTRGRRYAPGDRSRRVRTCTGNKREENPIESATGYGSCLKCDTIKNTETDGIRQRRSDRLQDPAVSGKQRALRVLGRTPIIALNLGDRKLCMSLLVMENLDKSDQFFLGRVFIRNFDIMIDLNIAMFRI